LEARVKPRNWVTPTRLWILLFATWLLILTGVFGRGPGFLQLWRLDRLLASKQTKLQTLESQIAQMEGEKVRLEKSAATQEREVRRVLGYAASDEIIFDFAAPIRADDSK